MKLSTQVLHRARRWTSTSKSFTTLALSILILVFNAWCFGSQLVHFETVLNTEYVSAGVGGMRNVGSGTITVSGIPAGAQIKFAYLYWHGPTNSTDPNANAHGMFNGTPIVGTNIGVSGDNNWGFVNSQAYRADVTSIVASVGGNGVYPLTSFGSSTAAGGANTNGASLIIFYDDKVPANYRDVILLNGNDSNGDGSNCPLGGTFDPAGWNATVSGINFSGGTGNLQLHVADGQSYRDDALLVNGQTLVAEGPIFQGDSVPGLITPGINPEGVTGNLWDIKNYDVTQFLTSDGPSSLTVTTGVSSDCLSLVATAVDVPSGTTSASQTAPPVPVTQGTATDADFSFSSTTGQIVDHQLHFPANTPFPTGPTSVNVLSKNRVLSDSPDWPPYVIGTPFAPSHLFVKNGDNQLANGTSFGSMYDDACYPVNGDPASATEAQCPGFDSSDTNPADVITAKDIFDPATKPDITPGPVSPACATDACTAALIHFFPTQSPPESWSPSATSPNPACNSPLSPTACDLNNLQNLEVTGDQTTLGGGGHKKGAYVSVYNVPMLETQVVVNGVAVNTPGRQGSGVVTVPFQSATGSTVFNLYPAGCFPGPTCVTGGSGNNYFTPAPAALLNYSINQGANTVSSASQSFPTAAVNNQTVHDGTVLSPGQYTVQWKSLDSVGIIEQNISKTAPANGQCPDGSPAPVGAQCYVTSPFTATFTVFAYNFSGFFQPVDNLPAVNTAKGGSAVPVKFSLGGNYGLNIFASGSPGVASVALSQCSNTALQDTIETTVPASSNSLSYDPTSNQYNFVWKTPTKAGCYVLTLKFNDGFTTKSALFLLK